MRTAPKPSALVPITIPLIRPDRASFAIRCNRIYLALLIEVLSPSTEAYDRSGKFAHYRKVPTLHEYLLVTQDQPSIERYVRHGHVWILSEAVGLEASVPLESIGCILSLRDVYDKVLDDAGNI